MESKMITGVYVIVMVIVTIVYICFSAKQSREIQKLEERYAMCTVVVDISEETNTVTVRDFNGNLWQFKGTEDWEVDDICSCVMDGNSTPEIYDDEIVSVRYNGGFSNWK